MKSKILLLMICNLFAVTAFAQVREARKFSEFHRVLCGQLMALLDNAFAAHKEDPTSKLYVFYYEGKDHSIAIWNQKTKKEENRIVRPRRGDALNAAKEVLLYAKGMKFDENKIILIEGGHRNELTLELWLVPEGAAPPKATPTVDEKDVVFDKGKPRRPMDCSHVYDGY